MTDVFLVIPAFLLVIVLAAYSKNGGNGVIIAVLVLTGWSYGARPLRAQVLSLRHREFLTAARLRGERTRATLHAIAAEDDKRHRAMPEHIRDRINLSVYERYIKERMVKQLRPFGAVKLVVPHRLPGICHGAKWPDDFPASIFN